MTKNADFEKLNFDEGFGYEGEISINFFGKDVNVDLTVNVEDEKIADIQYETYEKFKEKWNEFQKDVAERIIKYYNEEEKGSYGPEDKEEFDKWWPEINTIDELLNQIELDGIIIPESFIMEDVAGGRCIYLTFSKKWGNDTEDNGIGVKIVNEEITKLVAKQKKLGFHAITDGEFRRTFWHLDFMWGFEGVEHEDTGNGVKFDAELAKLDDTYLVGKIKAKAHPFVEYFKFLKQFEDENTVAKYTIPAPAQTFQQFIVPNNIEGTRKFYADNDELIKDIAAAYSDVIKQFYDAGCRNLQLDDCTWGAVVGDAAAQRYQSLGIDIETVKEQLLKVNNLALENKPADMVITSHICRGNYHSTYFTSGAYDPVADYVFARENVDALLLEYDDERSGGFEPLAKVSSDKKVVLGLITTKSPKLENKEDVIKRIHEAAKYVPLERLCLSPQCGFASCEIGNKLTEEEQWAKLKLIKEIADEVWG